MLAVTEGRIIWGASHLGQFTQTAWESNAKLGKVLGTYGNED